MLAALGGVLGLPAARAAGAPEANSADRVIFWTSCDAVIRLTDAELDVWRARGVDGFVCMTGYLYGLGGPSSGALERRLRDVRLGDRARKRGMKLYLGFYASNYFNRVSPFVDWMDDRGWSRTVLPHVERLAAAARRVGFSGLALDQEMYRDERASWDWDYREHGRSEAFVRDEVRRRGAQLMTSMVRGFPGLELMAYHTKIPGSWEELVHERGNGLPAVFRDNVQIDLWDGLSSVRGYRAIRWVDGIFYKTPQLPGVSWDAALRYNASGLYSALSRRFSNWRYASSRLHVSPFSWISSGRTTWEQARAPDHVAVQLDAFRKWGTGREFANYAANGLTVFDYSPYVSGLRDASAPERVDASSPRLVITGRSRGGRRLALRGRASDNLALRAVRWRSGSGRGGVMRLRWIRRRGEGGVARFTWTARGIPVPARGGIEVVAEDIKGLTTTRKVRLPQGRRL